MRFYKGLLVLIALQGVVLVEAEDRWLGLSLGGFFPQDQRLKDRLGSGWMSFGFSPRNFEYKSGIQPSSSWSLLRRTRNDNKLFASRATVGIAYGFGEPRSNTMPYLAVRFGPTYLDYSLALTGTSRVSTKRIGWGGQVELGVVLSGRWNFFARYDWTDRYDGINFGGLTLSAEYKIFRF